MDAGVSWQQAVLISKLRYPNADMSTILYFAKQIYIAECKPKINIRTEKVSKQIRKPKERFILQGASI